MLGKIIGELLSWFWMKLRVGWDICGEGVLGLGYSGVELVRACGVLYFWR